MKTINPNLDPVSHTQMFEIVAREAIEALEKQVKELDLRVATLEDARRRQIVLNQELLDKTAKKIEVKEEKSHAVIANWKWPWQ